MPKSSEVEQVEMLGSWTIKAETEPVQVTLDTGVSLERYSINGAQFKRLEEVAQSRGIDIDVLFDEGSRKFGFGKDLFDLLLEEDTGFEKKE